MAFSAHALLDALLRPLAVLPPGLAVVVADPAALAAPALASLGFDITAASAETASALPVGAFAWGVVVVRETESGAPELAALAEALRPALVPGAWLSVAAETDATASALVGAMETAGYVLAQAPETLRGTNGHAVGLHGVFRRVEAGVIG